MSAFPESILSFPTTLTVTGSSQGVPPEARKAKVDALVSQISKNPFLSEIHISREMKDNELGRILYALDGKRSLTTLDIREHFLGPTGAFLVSEYLNNNDTLTELNLNSCFGNEQSARAFSERIGDGLSHNSALQSLSLAGNWNVSSGVICTLAYTALMHGSISKLDLSNNQIGPEGGIALAQAMVREGSSITDLDLGENKLFAENEKVTEFVHLLFQNTKLKTLCLAGLDLAAGRILPVAESLSLNTTLTTLDLTGCLFVGEGCQSLLQAIAGSTTLTSLSFGFKNRPIGDVDCLVDVLPFNTTLTALSLRTLGLTEDEKARFIRNLVHNSTLTTLDLSGSCIKGELMPLLADALTGNTSLESLNLNSNFFGSEGSLELFRGLKGNTTLKDLYLRSCSLGDSEMGSLAACLSINMPPLQSLSLVWNIFSPLGTVELAESLVTNTTLTRFDIGLNALGDPGYAALIRALGVNGSITRVDVESSGWYGEIISSNEEALQSLVERNLHNQRLKQLHLFSLLFRILNATRVLSDF